MANKRAVFTSTFEVHQAALPDELYPLWQSGVRQLFEYLDGRELSARGEIGEVISMGFTQQTEALPSSAVKR